MEKKEKICFYFILFFLNKPPDGRAVIELLTLLDVAQPHRHTQKREDI
jgi:hypothetical protein